MAFESTGLVCVAAADLSGFGGARLWKYTSGDPSTDVCNVTGYFAGMGQGSRTGGSQVGSGPAGLRVGDTMIVQESTSGAAPGRTVMASVISSTLNNTSLAISSTVGYDVTLSVSSTA